MFELYNLGRTIQFSKCEFNERDAGTSWNVPSVGHRDKRIKDGPGPVMVSDTLCPAVHILGT